MQWNKSKITMWKWSVTTTRPRNSHQLHYYSAFLRLVLTQLQPEGSGQPVCAISPTVAYRIHSSTNPLITNSSIPPSSLLQSSQNLWLSDVGAFQKPLPNIEGAKTIGPRILGSFPGYYRGSGGKRNRIIRHATFSDSFLHSRKNGLLGEIRNKSSNLGEVRQSVSAGVAGSNTSTSGSNPVAPRKIRFHSVDGSHFVSPKAGSRLQNIMTIHNQESKINKNEQRTSNSDSSSKSDDKNEIKSKETYDSLKERAKRLKRIIEEDKKNNNTETREKQTISKSSLRHKNYCDERKTNLVVKWLTEVNKEMYDSIDAT